MMPISNRIALDVAINLRHVNNFQPLFNYFMPSIRNIEVLK